MPVGYGDVGANVWVRKNGDLLLHVSKVVAFNAEHLLPKLGRARLPPKIEGVSGRRLDLYAGTADN